MENGATAGQSHCLRGGDSRWVIHGEIPRLHLFSALESSAAPTLPASPGSRLTRVLGIVFPCSTAEQGRVNESGEE